MSIGKNVYMKTLFNHFSKSISFLNDEVAMRMKKGLCYGICINWLTNSLVKASRNEKMCVVIDDYPSFFRNSTYAQGSNAASLETINILSTSALNAQSNYLRKVIGCNYDIKYTPISGQEAERIAANIHNKNFISKNIGVAMVFVDEPHIAAHCIAFLKTDEGSFFLEPHSGVWSLEKNDTWLSSKQRIMNNISKHINRRVFLRRSKVHTKIELIR